MTSNSNLTQSEADNLLRFGVYASSYFPEYSQISLQEVVSNLIRGQKNHTYNLTRDLAPAMEATGSKMSITTGLSQLQIYINGAPHDDCSSTGKILVVAAAVVTLLFIIARLVVRKFVIRTRIEKADWAMFAAWLVTVCYFGAIFLNTTTNQACHHVYDISFDQLRGILTYTFATEVLYFVGSCAIKLAYLVFYWKLAPRSLLRRTIFGVSVLCMILAGVAMLAVVFQCNPLDTGNQSAAANDKCVGKEKMLLVMGIANVMTDFLVLFLAIPIVWNFRMKLAEKVIVAGLFCIGVMVCGAAVARTMTNRTFVSDPDATYKQGTSAVWGIVELSLAILVSCVGAMAGLFSTPSRREQGEQNSPSPQFWQQTGWRGQDMEMVGKQRMRSMDSDGLGEVMAPMDRPKPEGKLEGRYYMKKDGWSDGDFEVGFAR